MILARLRQVGTWFWLGLGFIGSLALVVLLRGNKRRRRDDEPSSFTFDQAVEYTNDRVKLANARAAVEITAARTKNAAVKAELNAVVQSKRSEAEKLRELVALRERMGR